MSHIPPTYDVVVVQQDQAEMVGGAPVTGRLYADASATGGALSCQRIMLAGGASGAAPHHHDRSSLVPPSCSPAIVSCPHAKVIWS